MSLAQVDEALQESEIGYRLLEKGVVHGKVVAFVDSLQAIHQLIDKKWRHLEFDVRDFVWAELKKGHFSAGEYGKLSTKKIGLVEVIEKINPDAYRLKLPSNIRTAYVFNVKHRIPFTGDSLDDDIVPNFLSPRENDMDQMTLAFMDGLDRRRTRT